MEVQIMNELNESHQYRNVKRALFGDPSRKIKTFAILTSENPNGEQTSKEENENNLKQLKTALSYGHFRYVNLKGSYGQREHSFIIFNCALEDAKSLAFNFGQESFFWGVTENNQSKIGYYKRRNENAPYNLIEVTNKVTYEDEAEDFFSKFGFKFKINMKEFGDDVPEVTDTEEFEESLNENRTFMSRSLHRKYAYDRENR